MNQMFFSHTSSFRLLKISSIVYLIFFVLIFYTGCVSAPPRIEEKRQITLGNVAVATTVQEPEIEFKGYFKSKPAGAAGAAGGFFLDCVTTDPGTCSGFLCGPYYIFWVGVCGIGSVGAGIYGTVTSPNAEDVQSSEGTMTKAMQVKTIQESLRDEVAYTLLANGQRSITVMHERVQTMHEKNNYQPLATEGIDTLLIVTLTKAGIGRDSLNKLILTPKHEALHLYMKVHISIVHTRDNSEIFSTNYIYLGERRALSDWTRNNGAQLINGLQLGYKKLAEHIYDNIFLLYSFPYHDNFEFLYNSFGLAAISPTTFGSMAGDDLISKKTAWKVVDSLKPTLSWQAFPRHEDLKVKRAEMKNVKNVRYDLIIAKEHNLAPSEIVYQRKGLSASTHKLETTLQPNARYYWSVRARFELGGRERVTEWGSTTSSIKGQYTTPSYWSYRFKTPK